MALGTLTQDRRKGVKASILVLLLVLVLFATILAAGRPIMDFGTEQPSVAYLFAVYIPVFAICILAYRRLGQG